ncbi:MAG: sugar phosphate isomerase/epimerase [Clostridia bacterium]|nr:sugar phosphate isomerase/epimerase [Clostridia bacterium]
MFISTEINSLAALGDNKKVLKILKEAGFTAYDYSMFYDSHAEKEVLDADDYIERAKAFRAYADGLGLPCNQAHAPFPSATSDAFPRFGMTTEEYNAFAHKKIERAIEVAGVLGAKVIVVHPWNYYTPEENAALLLSFEATAKKAGVKIGVENMWNWNAGEPTACAAACSHHDDFKKHMDLLPEDTFVACLDIGHAEMAGLNTSAVQMIETLGDRLQSLHIHDNDQLRDQHVLPYLGKIDFSAMLAALKKIGYQGDITMEADRFLPKFPVGLLGEATRFLASVANYLKCELEK